MNLLTVKEVSNMLKVKESTLYAWAGANKIPSYKIQGLLRFNKAELEAWLENSRKEVMKKHRNSNKNNDLDIENIISKVIDEYK